MEITGRVATWAAWITVPLADAMTFAPGGAERSTPLWPLAYGVGGGWNGRTTWGMGDRGQMWRSRLGDDVGRSGPGGVSPGGSSPVGGNGGSGPDAGGIGDGAGSGPDVGAIGDEAGGSRAGGRASGNANGNAGGGPAGGDTAGDGAGGDNAGGSASCGSAGSDSAGGSAGSDNAGGEGGSARVGRSRSRVVMVVRGMGQALRRGCAGDQG